MSKLPTPDQAAQLHSLKLCAHLKNIIKNNSGAISFARYMHEVLYAKGLGYYNNGTIKLGKNGDFITAPLLSPLFSRCLARQCQQIFSLTAYKNILELGAGDGTMAADILEYFDEQNQAIEYFILEVSPDLRAKQQALIATRKFKQKHVLHWLDTLPNNFNGIILANEVLDALAVNCFTIKNSNIFERTVEFAQEKFIWGEIIASDDMQKTIQKWLPFADQLVNQSNNYQSEINLNLPAWLNGIINSMGSGVIIFIDYGFDNQTYYHPDRNQGTLNCHYQHYSHPDPFVYPGLQDITSHVNFSMVAEYSYNSGADLLGYTEQASYLLACGLLDDLANIKNEKDYLVSAQAIKKLTLPHEMGELFKVIALGKNFDEDLIGFAISDKSGRL